MSPFDASSSGRPAHLGAQGDVSTVLAEGFARRIGMLARRSDASAQCVRWAARAAYAVSCATAQGHVCLPLRALARRDGATAATVRAALFASGVACDGSQDTAALRPLVVDPQGRLYLARYYDYERRLAGALVAHAQARARAIASPWASVSDECAPVDADDTQAAHRLGERLRRYFGEPVDDAPDWQRVAAVMALSGRLTIVSGGPGTGKTTTMAGMLACLLDACADLRIALAAPTGKAAQRMQEALQARAGDLPPALAARLPQTSYTLHRLLGVGPQGRCRYHRDNPLPYDVIVIDEASMIDVAMAFRLLDAVAPQTRLVLLGDKDQLAAVEAGAVFAELSARPVLTAAGIDRISAALGVEASRFAASLPGVPDAYETVSSSAASADEEGCALMGDMDEQQAFWLDEVVRVPFLADSGGERGPHERTVIVDEPWPATTGMTDVLQAQMRGEQPMPHDAKPTPNPPDLLADCVVWLERNYRFGLGSPIGQLSLAIRRGAARDALAVLSVNPHELCVAAFHEDTQAMLGERSIARLAAGFGPYSEALAAALATRAPDPLPLFDALNRFRILCATRAGGRGVDQVNVALAAQVRQAARVPLAVGSQWFAGRPVMVARNDYALGLFNGDIGIALPDARGVLRVYFHTADGVLRALSPAALPPHDTAFALTVHKSQGSEFAHVVLVLPSTFSRVLSRELVYTAVTRARERVEVIGARDVLAQAIERPTQRDSGLAARIAEALREAATHDGAGPASGRATHPLSL